jgi:serine/threonine-protein phosphatase 2A regulatory subunit B
LQADKSAFKIKHHQRGAGTKSSNKLLSRGKNNKKEEINVDAIDFNKKILHASWHPNENSIAVAATNNLFIFTYVYQ